MLTTLTKLTFLLLICHIHLTHNIFLESIYQKYLVKQGLQFRENIFFGNKPILSEYDFVIIGGGVAGSVLANRLTENPNWKVLLLESGEDENIYTNIPLLAHFNSLTHFNWGYKLEKNSNHSQCLAMYNNQCPCPRGKGLGGSSILNYMIYTRGNKKDYDAYEAAGNKGWGYEDVLKYFLKAENNTSEFLDSDIHSHGGPLKVTNIPYPNLLTEKFTQASCELGYPLYDYTGKEPATEGFSKLQATLSKGQRCSANRAYLKSVKHRTSKNLHISIFTHVTRVLIDPNTKRAHGVEFLKNGVKRVVLAKKEVILSAGAIGSPQILLLSGVGPENHLREFDINVVSNLKGVGQNMHDHHSFFGLTFLVNKTNSGSTIEKRVLTMDQFLKWLKLGRGPLSVPGGVTGIGYLNTKYNTDKSYPDTEYLFSVGSFNSDSGRIFRKSMNVRKEVYDSVFGNINNREVWSIVPVVLRPKTRGFVELKSKNPLKYPRINYDFFQYDEDADVMLEGIKNVIKMSETDAFQSIGSKLHKTPISECAHFEFGCDDYWRCAMKYFTSSLYHQSGTCKMGSQDDPEAVVNDQLQVYGVTNLRVVDSSIFPAVPSAHLYAPTVMVAEKASDMIKESWKNTEDNNKHPNSGCYSHPTSNEIDKNKPNRTACNANNLQEPSTTEIYNKPNQLDNQKDNKTQSTYTSEAPSTTTPTTTTSTESIPSVTTPVGKDPTVPEQPDIFSGWETPTTSTTTTTEEVPYQEVTQTSTSTTGKPSPYKPSNPVSSTYPPHISTSNNNIAGPSDTFQQQTNEYFLQPQFPAHNQFSGFSNQSSISQGSNALYYPSDNYQIHTVYPGGGYQGNPYPPPAYNPQPYNPYHSNLQQSFPQGNYSPHPINSVSQSTQNGYPPAPPVVPAGVQYPPVVPNPGYQNPSYVSNEIVNPNEDIKFPPHHHHHHKHHNKPHGHHSQPSDSQVEPNYSGLTSLSNIPYYNQHLQREDFEPNPFSGNRSLVPAAIFINPELLFELQQKYLSKRSLGRRNRRLMRRLRRRLMEATSKPTEPTEQSVVTKEVVPL